MERFDSEEARMDALLRGEDINAAPEEMAPAKSEEERTMNFLEQLQEERRRQLMQREGESAITATEIAQEKRGEEPAKAQEQKANLADLQARQKALVEKRKAVEAAQKAEKEQKQEAAKQEENRINMEAIQARQMARVNGETVAEEAPAEEGAAEAQTEDASAEYQIPKQEEEPEAKFGPVEVLSVKDLEEAFGKVEDQSRSFIRAEKLVAEKDIQLDDLMREAVQMRANNEISEDEFRAREREINEAKAQNFVIFNAYTADLEGQPYRDPESVARHIMLRKREMLEDMGRKGAAEDLAAVKTLGHDTNEPIALDALYGQNEQLGQLVKDGLELLQKRQELAAQVKEAKMLIAAEQATKAEELTMEDLEEIKNNLKRVNIDEYRRQEALRQENQAVLARGSSITMPFRSRTSSSSTSMLSRPVRLSRSYSTVS